MPIGKANMAPIITTAHIVCNTPEAREKVFAAFHKIIEYSESNEPGVLRYLVTVCPENTSNRELYMIEEYASQEASDAHIKTQPVQDLIKLFTHGDVLAQPPEVFNTNIVHNKIARPSPKLSDNPAIILAHFEYKPGTLLHALEGWGQVVQSVKDTEPGTLGYTVTAAEDGTEIRNVEVYESLYYIEKVHLNAPMIAINQAHNGKDRTGVKGRVRVKAIDGYFGREKAGSKI